jgi:hypothetical protein
VKWANPASLPLSAESLSTSPYQAPPSKPQSGVPLPPAQPPPSFQVDFVVCEDLDELFWILKDIYSNYLSYCVWDVFKGGSNVRMNEI